MMTDIVPITNAERSRLPAYFFSPPSAAAGELIRAGPNRHLADIAARLVVIHFVLTHMTCQPEQIARIMYVSLDASRIEQGVRRFSTHTVPQMCLKSRQFRRVSQHSAVSIVHSRKLTVPMGPRRGHIQA